MARKPRVPEQPISQPLAAAWQHALDVAVAIGELEPWQHIAQDAVLGVYDPVSQEIDWCTAMGHAGEVFGIAIYQGDAGFASFQRLREGGVDELDQHIAQRAVTLIFESASTLMPASKQLLKRLGRKFRGANAWPELLVHEPGLLPTQPWNAVQLERIANALAGVAALVPWAHDDPAGGTCKVAGRAWVIAPPFADGDRRQQRLPRVAGQPVEPPPFDQLAVARLRGNGAAGDGQWFLDWFCGPSVVDGPEAAGRPFFMTHLIALDLGTGLLLATDVGRIDTAAADLQAIVLRLCDKQAAPAEIQVRREDLAAALQPFAAALGVRLRHDPALVAVTHQVHARFMEFLGH